MRTIRTLFWFLLAAALITVGIIFIMQNSQTISIRFARWATPEYPMAVLLIVTFVLGFLLAGLYFLIDIFRIKNRLRRSEKLRGLLEQEVETLRNQPLYEETPNNETTSPGPMDPHLTHEGQPEASLELGESKKAG